MGERRGLPDKPLAELTDAELNAELIARRAKRGSRPTEQGSLARHFASLELEEGAPLEAIERAYARLSAKYEPFVRASDRERREAAERLLEALRRAYEALRVHSAGKTSK